MKTKKIMLFFLSLFVVTTGFSENLTLENLSDYPAKDQKSKIAIQWATSAKEVDENNKALLHGFELSSDSIQVLNQKGKVNLVIPKKAEYFRILAWSKGKGDPDFHTNWVDVVPNKTYTLKADHLVPAVLMAGSGC